MDIRTKLVFALVAVALVSMVAFGAAIFTLAGEPLKETRLNELDGRAQSMKIGLEQVSQGWQDRVSLVASRTQLRRILQAYNRSPSDETRRQTARVAAAAKKTSIA